MTVKRSRSATRVLSVLEAIAHHQPVGVSELARVLEDDKSAVQRAIMTLADSGWIEATPSTPRRWHLTAHILTVAHAAYKGNDLLTRAKAALINLRNQTNETVLLTVPDIRGFVVIDVVESNQLLRTVPHLGMAVPARGSATSRAILPYMSPQQQAEILGEPPDDELRAHLDRTLECGYAISEGGVLEGSTNIAAPIFESDGQPVAAIVVSAPSDRFPAGNHDNVGNLVVQAAWTISRTAPAASA